MRRQAGRAALRGLVPAASLLLAVSCGDGSDPVRPGGVTVHRVSWAGIVYTAETTLDGGPERAVRTVVTMANRSRDSVTVGFADFCVARLRAYAQVSRRPPAAWRQPDGEGCGPLPTQVVIPPGRSLRTETGARASEVLGDSLPGGIYHFAVLLQPDGAPLEIPAGSASLPR